MDRRTFFNNAAQNWEIEHRQEKEKDKLNRLIPHFMVNAGDRVLDAGCGTGRLIPYLKKSAGSSGRVVEMDFAKNMLDIAKEKYRHSEIFFVQSDARFIPFKENSFDVVICFALLPHVPDKQMTLREFKRILKPNKSLIVAHTMSRKELNGFHKRVKGPVTQDLLPDEKEMEALFCNAGFRNLSITDQPSLYIARADA
ncbi:MAG: class I SAM-dependent methyltransferase [Candidatus Aminicenantes bacterium]|nr:class I SAM-dependent methyltransferase [Candidatus Aminicenantes bacterium]